MNSMVLVQKNGQMVQFMRVIIMQEKKKAKVNSLGMMEHRIKEILMII